MNVLAKFDKHLSASFFHAFRNMPDNKRLSIRTEVKKSERGELITPLRCLSINYACTLLGLA